MRDRTLIPQKSIKEKVTQDEIDSIREEGRMAQEFLDNSFVQKYLENDQKSILDMHAGQLINPAREERDLPNGKKVIDFPSEKEYTLLAGEYRFIKRMVDDMHQSVAIWEEMERRIKDETLEVSDAEQSE